MLWLLTEKQQNSEKKRPKQQKTVIYVLWFLNALEYIGSTKVVLRFLENMMVRLRAVNLAYICHLLSEEPMGNRQEYVLEIILSV